MPVDKPAPVDHPVHPHIRARWSPVAFDVRPVEPEKLRSLFEAARWASSSFNEQPWRFVVGVKGQGDTFERILSTLGEANAAWAQHAPVLVISVAKLSFTRNGNSNRHAWHDVGQAAASLAIQATELGLRVHQMAGFNPAKARTELGIPDDYEPVTAIVIGYPGDGSLLPETTRARDDGARQRRPMAQIVFGGTWEQPPTWLA